MPDREISVELLAGSEESSQWSVVYAAFKGPSINKKVGDAVVSRLDICPLAWLTSAIPLFFPLLISWIATSRRHFDAPRQHCHLRWNSWIASSGERFK